MKRLMLILLVGLAGGAPAETPWAAHFGEADHLAHREAVRLQGIYAEAGAHFARGEYRAAATDYDYAAWQGSVAAAVRLCAIEAWGVGVPANDLKAAFWCERAREAGYGKAALVLEWLDANHRVAAR